MTKVETPPYLLEAARRMNEISGYPAWETAELSLDSGFGKIKRPCLSMPIPEILTESDFRKYERNPEIIIWPEWDYEEEKNLLEAIGRQTGTTDYKVEVDGSGHSGEESAYITITARDKEALEKALSDFSEGHLHDALRIVVRSLVLKGQPRFSIGSIEIPGANEARQSVYSRKPGKEGYVVPVRNHEEYVAAIEKQVETLCPALIEYNRLIRTATQNRAKWRTLQDMVEDAELAEDIRSLLFGLLPAANPANAVSEQRLTQIMQGVPAAHSQADYGLIR